MRISLRWKILILTALAPVALAVGTLWTVNVAVSRHQAVASCRVSTVSPG